jgi:hypothetical protein
LGNQAKEKRAVKNKKMSDLSLIFDNYFVSVVCLFWNFEKGLMVAGIYAIIMRGLCRLLM